MTRGDEIVQQVFVENHRICDLIVERGGIKSRDVNPCNIKWHWGKIPRNQNPYSCLFPDSPRNTISEFSSSLVIIDVCPGIPYYWKALFDTFQVDFIIGLDRFDWSEVKELCSFSEEQLCRMSYINTDLRNPQKIKNLVDTIIPGFLGDRKINFLFSYSSVKHLFTSFAASSLLADDFLYTSGANPVVINIRNVRKELF